MTASSVACRYQVGESGAEAVVLQQQSSSDLDAFRMPCCPPVVTQARCAGGVVAAFPGAREGLRGLERVCRGQVA